MRVAGKGGRRSPKRAFAIEFSRISTRVIPPHPPYVDYLTHLGGQWQMLGNDVAGDCVSVTWANFRRLVTATLTAKTVYPPIAQVWQFYETQNAGFNPDGSSDSDGPGSPLDGGMDIQTALERLVKVGGPDGVKAVFFASVNLTNPNEVKAAIATCGALWTGINVFPNNDQEFSAEQPWDFIPGSQAEGGHSVLTGGYGTNAALGVTGVQPIPPGIAVPTALGGDEKFITWAEETSFTDRYWTNGVEEGWAVIWPEQLGTRSFEQGIDKAKLAAAYYDVTSTHIVLP